MCHHVVCLYQAVNLGSNFSDLLFDVCQTGFALATCDGQGLRFLTAQDAGTIGNQSASKRTQLFENMLCLRYGPHRLKYESIPHDSQHSGVYGVGFGTYAMCLCKAACLQRVHLNQR